MLRLDPRLPLHLRAAPVVALLLLVVLGCSQDRSGDTGADVDGFAGSTDGALAGTPRKLDVLWVVDSGVGAQSRVGLAVHAEAFVRALQLAGPVDVQMAVVSNRITPDSSGRPVVGRFEHVAAAADDTEGWVRTHRACSSPVDCAAPNGPLCDTGVGAVTTAPHGVGTSATAAWQCVAGCRCEGGCTDLVAHADCRADFESDLPAAQQRVRCDVPQPGTPPWMPSGVAQCRYVADVAACPTGDAAKAVVAGDDAAAFACNAMLRRDQDPALAGGIRAAMTALDPQGPNCSPAACRVQLAACRAADGADATAADIALCAEHDAKHCQPLGAALACQPQALLREGAALLVVFVSARDDCSVALDLEPTEESVLAKVDWGRCERLGDAQGSNTVLNEAECEFRRSKNPDITCPSDCVPGASTQDSAGKPKCPNGCATDSAEQVACLLAVEQGRAAWAKKHSAIAPVSTFVEPLRAMRPDPNDVLVAAIVGVPAGDPADVHAHNVEAVRRSMGGGAGTSDVGNVCVGGDLAAHPGVRYAAFAAAFGARGFVESFCSPTYLRAELSSLGKRVGQALASP